MKRTHSYLFLLLFSLLVFSCGGNKTSQSQPSTTAEVHVQAVGMKCGSCANTIESTFHKLPGVDSVKADPDSKDVFVIVDTTKTTKRDLETMIAKLGFDYVHDEAAQ